MTTKEVAKKVVELTRRQAWHEALDTLYDDNIVSVEVFSAGGSSPETRGKRACAAKSIGGSTRPKCIASPPMDRSSKIV